MVICIHQFLCQSPGLWTPDFEVLVIPYSCSSLQELTHTSFLFVLPHLPYRIIYLPGCMTVLICKTNLCIFFCSCVFSSDLIFLVSSFVFFFLFWGCPRIRYWLLSVPCSFPINCYKNKNSDARAFQIGH